MALNKFMQLLTEIVPKRWLFLALTGILLMAVPTVAL